MDGLQIKEERKRGQMHTQAFGHHEELGGVVVVKGGVTSSQLGLKTFKSCEVLWKVSTSLLNGLRLCFSCRHFKLCARQMIW